MFCVLSPSHWLVYKSSALQIHRLFGDPLSFVSLNEEETLANYDANWTIQQIIVVTVNNDFKLAHKDEASL